MGFTTTTIQSNLFPRTVSRHCKRISKRFRCVEMKDILVFVYGTLKQQQPNHRYLTDASNGELKFVSKARTVDDWPLVIASKFNIPYLLRKKGSGKRIIGEVYAVNETMLKFLDDFEGCPHYYNRFSIPVVTVDEEGKDEDVRLNPWCYFLTEFNAKLLQLPTHECYDSLGSHGLKYVERCDRTKYVDYSAIDDVKICSQRDNVDY